MSLSTDPTVYAAQLERVRRIAASGMWESEDIRAVLADRDRLYEALVFASSVIRFREGWTPSCTLIIDLAMGLSEACPVLHTDTEPNPLTCGDYEDP